MTTKGYKFVDHTADIEFLAFGSTIENSFKNSLMALFDTIADTKRLSRSKSKALVIKLKEKADTVENLLWYTLQDALSVLDAKKLFAYKVTELSIRNAKSSFILSVKLHAKSQQIDLAKMEVKGVSPYNLKIKKKGNGFSISAVLDV